jgi:hypothetical protein
MPIWSFYDFAEDAESVIEAELKALTNQYDEVKDKLDTILLKLRVMDLPWPRTFCKPYRLPKKAKEKIFEIRVNHLNVEYRFLSSFAPTPRAFTLLTVGTERDFKLKAAVVENARNRSRLIGPWRNVREHRFD